MDMSTKLLFTLPLWQKKIINQIIKEQNKKEPNKELLEKAKNACLKTQDENFIFAFAYYCYNYDYKKESIDFLLKKDASKWAMPCTTEVLHTLKNRYICIDALIDQGEYETAYKFAKKFGHNEKIQNYLMEIYEVDLVLDYAENIKGADLNKIGEFIKDYKIADSDKERFDKIYKNKIKKSKSLEQSLKLMGEDLEK